MSNINYIEESLIAVYENECNYNALMKAVGISELRYYSETGKDLFINESNAFNNFIDKAKEFFKKIIDKIKELFNKFTGIFKRYTDDDDEFIKKYSDAIRAGWPKLNIKLKPRDMIITINLKERIAQSCSAIRDAIDENLHAELDEFKDKSIDYLNDVRKACTNGQETSASSFSKDLKEFLTPKMAFLTFVQQEDIIASLKSYKQDIKSCEDNKKQTEDNMNKYISYLDGLKTELSGEELHWLSNKITIAKGLSNIMTTVFGCCLQAIKDKRHQSRTVAEACIRVSGYKESARLELFNFDIV